MSGISTPELVHILHESEKRLRKSGAWEALEHMARIRGHAELIAQMAKSETYSLNPRDTCDMCGLPTGRYRCECCGNVIGDGCNMPEWQWMSTPPGWPGQPAPESGGGE